MASVHCLASPSTIGDSDLLFSTNTCLTGPYDEICINTVCVRCLLILAWPTHTYTNFTMQYKINNQIAHIALDDWLIIPVSYFFFPLFRLRQISSASLHCLPTSTPDSFIIRASHSLNPPTFYLQYSSLSPSSILVLMSSGCGRCGVQSLSLTAASPAGCSHGAPNASLEYWINPRTTSVLPDQQHYYYLAITLYGVSGLRQDGWALNLLCCGRR